jgi:hypothetical protein
MSRKLAVILIAIAVAMAFAASMAVAGDPPTAVTIDKGAEKKSGVAFDHAKHAERADCFKCHHASKAKEEIKSCFECHGKDAGAPSVKDAFHDSCIACHKEQAKGPTKCKECHP